MPLLERIYELERARQVSIIPFFYSAPFSAGVATGASTTVNTSIQSDSDFVCRYITITVFNSPNVLVFTGLAAMTMSIFDSGSGRTLMDNAQPITNIAGGAMGTAGGSGGNAPFIFPEPWLVRAASTIQTTLTNLGTLTFPRIDVTYAGMKVFKFGSSTPAGQLL